MLRSVSCLIGVFVMAGCTASTPVQENNLAAINACETGSDYNACLNYCYSKDGLADGSSCEEQCAADPQKGIFCAAACYLDKGLCGCARVCVSDPGGISGNECGDYCFAHPYSGFCKDSCNSSPDSKACLSYLDYQDRCVRDPSRAECAAQLDGCYP